MDNTVLEYLQSQRHNRWTDKRVEESDKTPHEELVLYWACKVYDTTTKETTIYDYEEYFEAMAQDISEVIQNAIDVVSSEEYNLHLYLDEYAPYFVGKAAKAARRNVVDTAEAKSVMKAIKYLNQEVATKGISRSKLKMNSTNNTRTKEKKLSLTDVKKIFRIYISSTLKINGRKRRDNIISKIIEITIPL